MQAAFGLGGIKDPSKRISKYDTNGKNAIVCTVSLSGNVKKRRRYNSLTKSSPATTTTTTAALRVEHVDQLPSRRRRMKKIQQIVLLSILTRF